VSRNIDTSIVALAKVAQRGANRVANRVGEEAALFGPTWPERSGPWGHGHRVLQRWRSANHHAYRDPASAVGMAAIEVEDVHAAVAALLGLSDLHASVQNAALR
jgi:hypothetical protein